MGGLQLTSWPPRTFGRQPDPRRADRHVTTASLWTFEAGDAKIVAVVTCPAGAGAPSRFGEVRPGWLGGGGSPRLARLDLRTPEVPRPFGPPGIATSANAPMV